MRRPLLFPSTLLAMLLTAGWPAANAATALVANLIGCGSVSTGCGHSLPVAVNQPLGGTDPYFVQYCTGPGYTCLPAGYPIGDWVTAYVFNGGNADAGPFTAGLYLSRRVDPVTHNCALDYSYPLLDAIQLATASFSGLAQGYNMPIVFPRGNTVEYWQASQWNSGRDEIFRCLFVLVNDGNSVYELQPNEEDNIASTPVRILDLVDLVPSAYAVGFSSFPWMSARVYNAGIETSPSFAVDFYQIAADPITEACPVLTNGEFPLVVPGASAALYLGSITVDSLAPKAYRVVFPQVSRVPSTDTNATNTCLLVFIDSAYNVPEPFDGPYNIASQTVANADIRRFLQPPEIIIIHAPWNKFIILYAILGLIALIVTWYLVWRYRKHKEEVERHEAQYLERSQLKEAPAPPKEPEPVPFFKPDEEFLRKEEELAKENPDFNRAIRVNEYSKKTGIVRDKRGNIIGTLSPGGVIRDKTGRRIGVSAVKPPGDKGDGTPKPAAVLDGYFGKAV